MTKLRIRVTARDIRAARKACKGNTWEINQQCPVARGVRRNHTCRHDKVSVGHTTVVVANERTFMLPTRATDFINKFDDRTNKRRVRPFRFTMTEEVRP